MKKRLFLIITCAFVIMCFMSAGAFAEQSKTDASTESNTPVAVAQAEGGQQTDGDQTTESPPAENPPATTQLLASTPVANQTTTVYDGTTAEKAWQVSTPAELKSALEKGGYISITQDFSFTETWTPVTLTKAVIIDGNNHTLTGLNVTNALKGGNTGQEGSDHSGYNSGLIGTTSASITISNLTFADAEINPGKTLNQDATYSYENGFSQAAVIAGSTTGSAATTLTNVHIKNSEVTADTKCGLFVGNTSGTVTITGCSAEDSTVTGNYSYALLVGLAHGKVTVDEATKVKNCSTKFIVGSEFKQTDYDSADTIDGYKYFKYNYSNGKQRIFTLEANGGWINSRTNLGVSTGLASKEAITYDGVASINGWEYQSLNAAINSAQDGDTVEIIADCNVKPIEIGFDKNWTKGITIDGNGHTVTGWSNAKRDTTYNDFLAIDVYDKVNFKDINFKNFTNGETSTVIDAAIIKGYSGCDITVEDCTFENFNRQAIYFAPGSGGKMSVIGCTFDGSSTNEKYTIQKAILINPGTAGSEAVIKNCKISYMGSTAEGWSGGAIEVYGGKVLVEGCTITDCEAGVLANREYYNQGENVDVDITLRDTTISARDTAVWLSNYKGKGDNTKAKITMESGTYTGVTYSTAFSSMSMQNQKDVSDDDMDKVTFIILGGTFTGPIDILQTYTIDGGSKKGNITITGGTFSSDPKAYVADGYEAKQADGKYTVGLKNPEKVVDSVNSKLDTKTQQGEVAVEVGKGVAVEDKETAKDVAKSVSADLNKPETTKEITVSSDDKKTAVQKLVAAGQVKIDNEGNVVSASGGEVTITIIEEPYLEVEVTEIKTDKDTGKKELKLDITPKYNLLATTATGEAIADAEKVTVSTGNALNVEAKTDVKLQLPEGFAEAGDKLLVTHTKHDGSVEYLTGKVTKEGGVLYVSFTTTGFSPIVVSDNYAATNGEQVYPTLQAAVDAAKDGDVIKLMKDGETAVVRRTVSFTVDPSYKGADDSTGNYTYTITLGDGTTRNKTDNENEWSTVYTAPAKADTAKAGTAKTASSPLTGDNSELGLFAVVGLISAVGVALLLRRKQSN